MSSETDGGIVQPLKNNDQYQKPQIFNVRLQLKKSIYDLDNKQQIKGEVVIDLSNVHHCEEKEINFAFTIEPETQNDFLAKFTPLWKSIQTKLASTIPRPDEYSINIYNENVVSSPQQKQHTQQPDTELDRWKIGLIKNANDLAAYVEDCVMRGKNMHIPTRVPLIIKKICWNDEYKYLNHWLIEKRKEYEKCEIYERFENDGDTTRKKRIESSDACIDDLIEHFCTRQKMMKRHRKHIDIKLNKEERNGMEYLFDHLIKLTKIEGISDDIIKYIESAKKAAIRDEKWEKVLEKLRKAIKKQRIFDIPLFLKHYKEHEIACESLENENVVLFIGSTGAGKSTTIYFLNGVKMGKDERDNGHIHAKKDAEVGQELSNVKLAQSIRTSVTTHITAVPVMLKELLSNCDDINNNNNNSLKNKVIFCDTPGFGDSRGIEIDIANSFGLINAMQSAHCVRIIFVISKEDMAHKSKQLKILSDSLHQYLSNYESSGSGNSDNTVNSNNKCCNESESKAESKVQSDGDSGSESDESSESSGFDSSSDSDGVSGENVYDITIPSVNEKFLTKLEDINFIFTKFPNVESVKTLFNDAEMDKLEDESTKHKNAFYYLCKHINKLAYDDKNDNIILIDPITGDFEHTLTDIFVTSDAKWINVTQDNFQPYISPENLLLIEKQVIEDCKYINRIIESNAKMVYGGYNRNKNCNFNYMGLVENKIRQLTKLKQILASHCDIIIENDLNRSIIIVTEHWNDICKTVSNNVTGCSSHDSSTSVLTNKRSKMHHSDIKEYQSRVYDLKQVLNQLLVQYEQFSRSYLPNAINKYQIIHKIDSHLSVLVDECCASFTSDEKEEKQPQENKTPDTTTDNNTKESTVDDRKSSLLKCLIILQRFGDDYSGKFNDNLQRMENECLKHIKKSEFKYVVSVLKVLDGTVGRIADLKIESLQDSLQLQAINKVSNTIKREIANHLDMQLKNIQNLVGNVTSMNDNNSKEETFETTITDLKQAYNVANKGKEELEKYFIDDKGIQPKIMMEKVHAFLDNCCKFMESKIDKILAALISENTPNDKLFNLTEIHHLMYVIDAVMEISEDFNSIVDKGSIVMTIVEYLENVSNINNIERVLSEMEWIAKYHANKRSLGSKFESIISSKISDLNEYILKGSNITLAEINSCQQAVEKIFDQIITVSRCYYNGCNSFYGGCDTKKVNESISTLNSSLQKRIKQVFEDLEQPKEENKGEEKHNHDVARDMPHARANGCVELFEKCKLLQQTTNDSDNTFSAVIILLTPETQATIEKYFDNVGTLQCNNITNGLKYYVNLVNNQNLSAQDLTDVNEHACSIGIFEIVNCNLEKYKPLSKYLYSGNDINMVVSQWRVEMKSVYDELDRIISKSNNSSTIISCAMIICTALKIVDDCGILDENTRFSSLAERIELLIDNECKQLTKAIAERNFPSVSQKFAKQQQQLLVGGKYDYAREYLVNAMFTLTKQMIDLIQMLPTMQMPKYLEKRQILGELIKQTKQIITLKLDKYIDDRNQKKWDENLTKIFGQAQSSAKELLRLSSLNVKESRYDEAQSQLEILEDFESKLMVLNECQQVQDYATSENELKEVVEEIQQQLHQDCIKFASLDIKDYHSQSQPSTICHIISNAISLCNSLSNGVNKGKLRLIEYYKQAREKIEKSFWLEFETECKNIVKIRNNLYQHQKRVDRCCELAESLLEGNLKGNVSRKLNEMKVQFNRMRKDEDDKMVIKLEKTTTSLVDRVRGAKNAIFGVSTHKSSLSDFDAIYSEYLARIEYSDRNMIEQLRNMSLRRISDESEEIKACIIDNKLFDIKADSVGNLHRRIEQLKNICINVLADDKCENILKQGIRNKLIEVYKINAREIEMCKYCLKMQLNDIGTRQQQWFAVAGSKTVQNRYVTRLATYILRLLNGVVHYGTILVKVLPQQLEDVDLNGVTKYIYDLLNEYFEKWYNEVNKLIGDDDFDGSVPYFETALIFEQNEAMKQIRSSIGGGILKKFSCSNLSITAKKYLQEKQKEILDPKDGLGVINDNDSARSMRMRIKKYERLKKSLIVLCSSNRINKYLDVHTDLEVYQPCFSFISEEIKAATITISNLFKTQLNEESFSTINRLYSNLDALATVGIFDYDCSIENDRLLDNVGSLKQKIISKLKEIGKQAARANTSLEEIRRFMICLQIAQHSLIHPHFRRIVTTTMKIMMNEQKKRHGVLKLSQLFADPKLNLNEKYWCSAILNSFPIFSAIVTHSFNTKHGKNAKNIKSALKNMLAGKTGDKIVSNENKEKLEKLYDSFDEQYWDLVNRYIVDDNQDPNVDYTKKQSNIVSKLFVKIKQVVEKQTNDEYEYSCKIIKIMAHVFCVWTLLDSQHFFEMKKQHDREESGLPSPEEKKAESTVEKNEETDADSYDETLPLEALALYDIETCKSYLRQPKATQILAIMILLGLTEKGGKTNIKSNLIQVKTGEGKSLVLAVSACAMTLLGFDVYCVCHSELLTKRDYREFAELFIKLGVSKKVHYGMYGDICDKLIFNVFDLRNHVLNMICNTSKYISRYPHTAHRQTPVIWDVTNAVLLVDEVDVLFDQRHFGRIYRRMVLLQHESVSRIADQVWTLYKTDGFHTKENVVIEKDDKEDIDTKESRMNMELIKNCKIYKECQNTFGFWMSVIDQEIKRMIIDVQQTHNEYIVRDDQIGYYREDIVCFASRYGYKTMFAYYKEHERNKISKKALEKAKGIVLKYAYISFAELPLEFKCIAGVTGTLSELEMSRKDVLQDKYGINKYTYIPTMFEENGLIFDKIIDVSFVYSKKWEEKICEEINEKVNSAKPRPVLVFFQTNDEVQSFYTKYGEKSDENDSKINSKNVTLPSNYQVSILNEELTINEKMKVIKEACRLTTITLCTRIFGRGTDFIVTDDRVNELGGPHVIQTFFSLDISEEIQIQGRTARNGANGSFSMVLNIQKTRQSLGMPVSVALTYDTLNEHRKTLQRQLNEMALNDVEKNKVYHDKTKQLVECLSKENKEEALRILTYFATADI